MDFLTEPRRAWIYRILVAVAPLVVFYGVATDAEVALWLGAAGAILGNGLAALNTSTHTDR